MIPSRKSSDEHQYQDDNYDRCEHEVSPFNSGAAEEPQIRLTNLCNMALTFRVCAPDEVQFRLTHLLQTQILIELESKKGLGWNSHLSTFRQDFGA